MRATDRSSDRLWLWFAVSSVIFLTVLAISPFKDYFSEYRSYQKQYRRLLLDRAGSRRQIREARALSVGIRQVWMPELDDRVDRCTTCHLGVENPDLVDVQQPFRTHPKTPHTPDDFGKFGCVVCHRGQGRATTTADAHAEVADWDSPMLPLRYTEASCGRCHLDNTVPEASLLSEGRELMERAGCFACHKLDGRNWHPTAPDLNGLKLKTYPNWLRAWLKEPTALLPGTLMPNFRLTDEEIEALVAFLWVQPATPEQKVHPDAEPPPGDYDRGRKIFRESRCISCHTVGGRGNGTAPELSGIGSKVNRPWLVAYLEDPHSFQPDTEMPRYNFTRQDLLDVSQYMTGEFIDFAAPEPGEPLRPSRKTVEAGEGLYKKYGCAGCHRIAGRQDLAQVGPELNGIGDKPVHLLDFGDRDDLPQSLPDWLAAKISEPRSFREGLKMPVFKFTPEQVQALVTALLSISAEPLPETYGIPGLGPAYRPPGRFGELVDRYRCLSCHQVQGTGGEISTAPLTAEGSKAKREWLENYLLVPTTIRPLLTDRMLPLRMPREEAAFIADFIKNVYVDNDIPGELFPQGPEPLSVERGRRLYLERYGCHSCHTAEGRGGYYGPLLDGLGDRLESGWVYSWLRGPQRLQPGVRCPDFGLDEQDAKDLTAYIASISARGAGDGS